jgi:hypothetical protein
MSIACCSEPLAIDDGLIKSWGERDRDITRYILIKNEERDVSSTNFIISLREDDLTDSIITAEARESGSGGDVKTVKRVRSTKG